MLFLLWKVGLLSAASCGNVFLLIVHSQGDGRRNIGHNFTPKMLWRVEYPREYFLGLLGNAAALLCYHFLHF